MLKVLYFCNETKSIEKNFFPWIILLYFGSFYTFYYSRRERFEVKIGFKTQKYYCVFLAIKGWRCLRRHFEQQFTFDETFKKWSNLIRSNFFLYYTRRNHAVVTDYDNPSYPLLTIFPTSNLSFHFSHDISISLISHSYLNNLSRFFVLPAPQSIW